MKIMKNHQKLQIDTLSKTNEWVRYAEAKNASLIVLSSSIVFIILDKFITNYSSKEAVFWYLLFVSVSALFSLVVALISFIPRIKSPWLYIGKPTSNENILYFGNACKYSPEEYLKRMNFHSIEGEMNSIELMYAGQIITNSKIAYLKYQNFNISLWFLFLSLTSPIGVLVIYLFKKDNDIN